jgi:hypothetical protein
MDTNVFLAIVTKWEELYPRHYSGIFVAPLDARNAETKHQSGAVPSPTTSLIGFDN